MKSLSMLMAGTLVSGLALTSFAYAQQQQQQQLGQQQFQQQQGQQLNRNQVQQFVQRIERDINQIRQSGNLQRMTQWTQNNIADNATFAGSVEIYADGERKGFVTANLEKQDLLKMQRFALTAMPDHMQNMLQNYNLNIQVQNVQPIGDSAAIVTTQITESAQLGGQGMAGQMGQRQQQFTEGAGQDDNVQQQQAGQQQRGQQFRQQFGQQQRGQQQVNLQFETEATCTHLIQRSPDGNRLQIGLTTCQADLNAGG